MAVSIEELYEGRYAVLHEGEQIGYIDYRTYDYSDFDYLELDYIEIDYECQGKGFGTDATRLLVETARERGVDCVGTSRVVSSEMEKIVRRLDFERVTDEPDASWAIKF